MIKGQNLGKLLTFRNERISALQETLAAALLQRDELQAKLDAAQVRVKELVGRFGDGPCYYCGKVTSSLAGNPGLWPIPLCHNDEPGVVKKHHVHCVSERLAQLTVAQAQRDEAIAILKSIETPVEVGWLNRRDAFIAKCEQSECGEGGGK